MKMTMRWFGPTDTVRLEYMAQVPCVTGIVSALDDIPVGEVWPIDKLAALKAQVEAAGFTLDVIESIPVAEAIKLGLPERDGLIENYAQSIRHLGKVGIRTLCYNFMPVFDWMRTDLLYQLPDGSMVTAYANQAILDYDLALGLEARTAWVSALTGDALRAAQIAYEPIGEGGLFENLAYFLRCIVPAAEEAGVFLALHPDDPPWSIFGLPRIVRDLPTIQRILDVVDSPHHGLTFCTGSLGTLPSNDLPAMIRQFAGRINFVHARNVKVTGDKDFYEVAHPSECGSVNMAAVIEALVKTGFDGPMRSDHGRMIWGETGRTGYGLYDRALGTMYLHGLVQGIQQARSRDL
jgi:mannonate dehydratase